MGERIKLSNGWWEIKEHLTRGDRRKIDRHSQEIAIGSVNQMKAAGVDIAELQNLTPREDRANPDEDDMMLVVGTIAWSWDEPVTLESVYERDEAATEIVLERMKNLYQTRSTAERDALKNA